MNSLPTDHDGARAIRWAGYDGCIELSNASTRVVLDPNVGGRVLSYALNGIESLWQEPAMNGVVWDGRSNIKQPSAGRFDIGPEYGGLERSQLWLGRWRAEITGERSARMTSPACPAGVPPSSAAAKVGGETTLKFSSAPGGAWAFAAPGDGRTPSGVQLIRDFVLDSDSPALKCTQTIRNLGSGSLRVFHWSRTFLPGNGIALAPLPAIGKFPRGYALGGPAGVVQFLPELEPNIRVREGVLEILGPPSKAKFLLDVEPGWLAYISQAGLLFVKRFPTFPHRVYGELGGNNASIWYSSKENAPTWSGSGQVAEIEAIGPQEMLAPGEECSFAEEWWLEVLGLPPQRQADLCLVRKIAEGQ